MRTAIIVLGMHRSGTSALAWLLGKAGVELPSDPLPPQSDSPLHVRESAALVAAHTQLLRDCHSSWCDPRPLEWQKLPQDKLEQNKANIREAIERGWSDASLVVIDDPRICRFVPLLAEILQEMGFQCRALLTLRSPDIVVASLEAHESMGSNYVRLLWLRHMFEAELATRAMRRIVLCYETVIENWHSAIRPISKIMGRTWKPSAEQILQIDACLRAQERDGKVIREGQASGVLAGTVERVWKGLNALSDHDGGDARRELDRANGRFREKTYLEGATILTELRRLRGRALTGGQSSTGSGLRAHVVAHRGDRAPQSSAYIRLLQPLSHQAVRHKIQVSLDAWQGSLPPCDVCIVQRAALPDVSAAKRLVEQLGEERVPLVVDLDDGFHLMDPKHAAAGAYMPRIEALELLLDAAAEVWFATRPLADCYPHLGERAVVIPNSIDPSLWCDWPQRRLAERIESGTRFLYMGTGTHAVDFALVRPSFERLWKEKNRRFSVTLIGITEEKVEPAPWLTHMTPPAGCRPYPKFVEWLREQGPFDVGIAPLADTPFNRVKSDIKLLDYSAMGLRTLASNLPAYTADPAFGSAVVTDWFEALGDVIDNPEEAKREARAAVAHVWLDRTTRGAAVRLLQRLEALVNRLDKEAPHEHQSALN